MAIFDVFPMDIRAFAQRFISEVCGESVTSNTTDREWTGIVKDVLRFMGQEQRFAVSPNRSKGQGEYLLDLLWQKPAPCPDIILAVESEWGTKTAVLDDFEKLMHVKSVLKLMVYGTSRHEKQSTSIRHDINQKYIKTFTQHLAGEQYLLVEFAVSERMAYAYFLSLREDGPQSNEADFKELLATPIRLGGDPGPLAHTVKPAI